jgi:Zn-dependent protease
VLSQRPAFSFPLFGFVVNVAPTFLLLTFLELFFSAAGWQAKAAWLVGLSVGVLVHELGHAVTARALGVEVGPITLWALGGYVVHARTTPGRQLAISLAGPVTGLIAGGAVQAAAVSSASEALQDWATPFFVVTVVYGLLNLLPALPLDGGNALRSALIPFLGRGRAEQITAGTGLLLGAGLLLWAVAAPQGAGDQPFAGYFGVVLFFSNAQVLYDARR